MNCRAADHQGWNDMIAQDGAEPLLYPPRREIFSNQTLCSRDKVNLSEAVKGTIAQPRLHRIANDESSGEDCGSNRSTGSDRQIPRPKED